MPEKSRNEDIGQRIAAWRCRRGLSQGTVARRAGLNQSYLSRLEAGKIQPNLRTARRIAAALRISLPELFEPSPPESTQRPCPVSRGGQCLMDLVDTGVTFEPVKDSERYSRRQLRLIRRLTAVVGQNERQVLNALDVLSGKLLVVVSTKGVSKVRSKRGRGSAGGSNEQ